MRECHQSSLVDASQICRESTASRLVYLHDILADFADPDHASLRIVVTLLNARRARMLRLLTQQLPKLPNVLNASAPCITQATQLLQAAFTTGSRCVHHSLLLLSLPHDLTVSDKLTRVSVAAATSRAHGVHQLHGQAPAWHLPPLQSQQDSQQQCKPMQQLLSR
jgi:hypothetical protein